MKKEYLRKLEMGVLAGVTVASLVLSTSALNKVDAASSKYGTIQPDQEACATEVVPSSNEAAEKHEQGMANGTAGENVAPTIVTESGSVIGSSVPGCYNTRKFGGGVAISDRSGGSAMLNRAVNLGPGESSYAYVMDSSCGDVAKSVLYATATNLGYPVGPILDINIGKKTAAGSIEYPDAFAGNGGVLINYSIPAGYRMPGYEPAFICLLPDGTTELIPNLTGGVGYGGIFVDHPKGVYMLTQVPAGSLSKLHDQFLLKEFNSYFGTSYSSLSAFGPSAQQ